MSRRSIAVVFAVLCACLPSEGWAHRDAAPAGPAAIPYGAPAPDFAFDAGDGTHRLAEFAGKPVVVNFWATWCHPCDDELDAFARLGRTYGGSVALLAISEERRDVAEPFLRAHGVEAFAIADPDHKIFARFGVAPIPVTIVLNRLGDVTHVSVGELDWPELEAAIEQASAPVPEPSAT